MPRVAIAPHLKDHGMVFAYLVFMCVC